MSGEIHLTTDLLLGIIGTSFSLIAMVYSYMNSAKRLEHRLTALELKIDPIWDAIRLEIPKLLLSPHTDEFDELIQKSINGLINMTIIEVKRLLELLDSEYQKAISENEQGRAIGIALFRATLRARSVVAN